MSINEIVVVDILVGGVVRVLSIGPWPLWPFSSPVLHPRLCRVAFPIFFSQIPSKDGARTSKQENFSFKSLLDNFQDGELRARLLGDHVKQPFLRDLTLTSNSLGCCCCVIKFTPLLMFLTIPVKN